MPYFQCRTRGIFSYCMKNKSPCKQHTSPSLLRNILFRSSSKSWNHLSFIRCKATNFRHEYSYNDITLFTMPEIHYKTYISYRSISIKHDNYDNFEDTKYQARSKILWHWGHIKFIHNKVLTSDVLNTKFFMQYKQIKRKTYRINLSYPYL